MTCLTMLLQGRLIKMPPPPEIVLVPLVINSIWDSDTMTKCLDNKTDRKKRQCSQCGEEWFERNATKALGHGVVIIKDINAYGEGIVPN